MIAKNVVGGFRVVGLLGFWVFLAAPGWAHPFHISTAELEFNPQSGRVEVSLRLHSVDFERALSLLAQQRIQLESDDADQWAARYLSRHFFVADLDAMVRAAKREKQASEELGSSLRTDSSASVERSISKSQVHWVGKELDAAWLTLYFELELSAPSPGRHALVNSVLMGSVEQQINTVSLRQAGKRHAMKLTKGKPWSALPQGWLDSGALSQTSD